MASVIDSSDAAVDVVAVSAEARPLALIASIARAVSRLCLHPPAVFEIRNIRTGELKSHSARYVDGTAADRAARQLGPDWRVFRSNDD